MTAERTTRRTARWQHLQLHLPPIRFQRLQKMTGKEPPLKDRARPVPESPTRITDDGVVVVAPQGRLDLAVAPGLRRQLIGLVAAGHTRVVVDLSAVELIDSSGLGALVAGFEAARDNGGDLKIMSPTEQAILVLELTNVNRVLRTAESAEMAFDDYT
jgi:anti-sigma B factor antagonist